MGWCWSCVCVGVCVCVWCEWVGLCDAQERCYTDRDRDGWWTTCMDSTVATISHHQIHNGTDIGLSISVPFANSIAHVHRHQALPPNAEYSIVNCYYYHNNIEKRIDVFSCVSPKWLGSRGRGGGWAEMVWQSWETRNDKTNEERTSPICVFHLPFCQTVMVSSVT